MLNTVGISGLFVRPGRVGGAEQMLNALVKGLDADAACGDVILTVDAKLGPSPAGAGPSVSPVVSNRNRFLAEYAARAIYRKCDAVIFPNYFTPPGLARHSTRLTAIHDLQFRYYPQNFSSKKRAWLRYCHGHTLRAADVVVALSNSVRDDIQRWHGESQTSKVRVIGNPVDWSRLDSHSRAAVEHPYFLVVSAAYPHKNIDTLIRAYAEYVSRSGSHRLVIVGAQESALIGVRATGRTLGALIDELNLNGQVRLAGFVSDSELGAYYANADALFHPSLFEGFGISVVEALGLGIPAIVSDLPALREVTKGAAVFCATPTNAPAWSALMHEFDRTPRNFDPAAGSTKEIRDTYDPSRVARKYILALNGRLSDA